LALCEEEPTVQDFINVPPGKMAMDALRNWGWNGTQDDLRKEERKLMRLCVPQTHFKGPRGSRSPSPETLGPDPMDNAWEALRSALEGVNTTWSTQVNPLYGKDLTMQPHKRRYENVDGIVDSMGKSARRLKTTAQVAQEKKKKQDKMNGPRVSLEDEWEDSNPRQDNWDLGVGDGDRGGGGGGMCCKKD